MAESARAKTSTSAPKLGVMRRTDQLRWPRAELDTTCVAIWPSPRRASQIEGASRTWATRSSDFATAAWKAAVTIAGVSGVRSPLTVRHRSQAASAGPALTVARMRPHRVHRGTGCQLSRRSCMCLNRSVRLMPARPFANGDHSGKRRSSDRRAVLFARPEAALVHVAAASRPVRRAQVLLEDLAARVAGQRVDPLHRRRALVLGELLAAVLDQLLLGHLRAGPHHEGLGRLTPTVVGHADDGGIGDG